MKTEIHRTPYTIKYIPEETITIKVEITPEEAYWIKSVSQNYLGHGQVETKYDQKIRESIFNGLPTFCELGKLFIGNNITSNENKIT